MRKGLIYSVEVILLMFLLILYVNQLFPSMNIHKNTLYCENTFYLKTLLTSLVNPYINKLLEDFEIDSIAILLKRSLSNVYSGVYLQFNYYDPITLQGNYASSCNLIMYPLPYEPNHISLEVYNSNFIECTNISYDKDWYFLVISGLSNAKNSVFSINLTDIFNKYPLANSSNLDVYSIFAYDLQGMPLKINEIYYNKTWLNISLDNIYNNVIFLVFRIKNQSTYSDLTYLGGRYTISSVPFAGTTVINSTTPGVYVSKFSWITLAISKDCYSGGKIVVELDYPDTWNLHKNYSLASCSSVKRANYTIFNYFRYIPDISSILGSSPKTLNYGGSLVLPGLEYKKIKIYVAS